MRLVHPEYEIIKVDGLERIALAGRCCYQSEPKGDVGEFVRKRIRTGHFSVLEHYWIAARIPWEFELAYKGAKFLLCKDDVYYGNVRAWREWTRANRLCLPKHFKNIPVIFDDFKETTCLITECDLPEPVHCVRFVCDRGVSHELVRHRPVAYSQESTRYCNYGHGVTFVIPPWFQELVPGDYTESREDICSATDTWFNQMLSCENGYYDLLSRGESPQQARGVLPNSLKTEIYVTAPESEWVHMFAMRTAEAAHPQMRELMCPLFDELCKQYNDLGLKVHRRIEELKRLCNLAR